jgi:hypothetical protein
VPRASRSRRSLVTCVSSPFSARQSRTCFMSRVMASCAGRVTCPGRAPDLDRSPPGVIVSPIKTTPV